MEKNESKTQMAQCKFSFSSGVPVMYVSQHKYTIERMPDAYGAPKN